MTDERSRLSVLVHDQAVFPMDDPPPQTPFVKRGATAHVTVLYQRSLSSGPYLADALLETCEQDYERLRNWFGFDLPYDPGNGLVITLTVQEGRSGAYHHGRANPQIFIDAFDGDNPDLARWGAVAEMTEVFGAVQASRSDIPGFQGWDPMASHGEALSRALATELYPDQLTPPGGLGSFATADTWLNGVRKDFVTSSYPSDVNFEAIGCGVLFINYLRHQLDFSLEQIIRAPGATLHDTYRQLTGRTDSFAPFNALLRRFFPPGRPSGLLGDNPFPLAQWRSLGGAFAYPPAVVPAGPATVHVLAVGRDHALHANVAKMGEWHDWRPLGGTLVQPPSVIATGPQAYSVFGVGTDSQVFELTWNNGVWSDWAPIGGAAFGPVVAVSADGGRIDLFARGQDSTLQHCAKIGGTWTSWAGQGGPIFSAPSAVAWGPDRLQVVALGAANDVLHQSYDGGTWSGWESLGGSMTSPPVIVAPHPNRLDILARGVDLSLQHRFWDGSGWGSWSSLGGVLGSGPAAMAVNGRIEVLVIGRESGVWRRFWDGMGWGSFVPTGGTVASPPVPFPGTANSLAAFVLGLDHAIWHQTWA